MPNDGFGRVVDRCYWHEADRRPKLPSSHGEMSGRCRTVSRPSSNQGSKSQLFLAGECEVPTRCRHLVYRMAHHKAAIHRLPQASRTRDLMFAYAGACANKASTSGPSSFTVVDGFAELSREVRDAAVFYLAGVIGAPVPPTY